MTDELGEDIPNMQLGQSVAGLHVRYPPIDEKEQDRLGRLRPEVFDSTLKEIGFCASVLLSNIMAVCLPYSLVSNTY